MRLWTPNHWPAWLGIGIVWLLVRLPQPMLMRLGASLGAVLGRVLGSRRRVAAVNLALCFPELTEAEREVLLQRSFRSLGVGVFEFARAWWGSIERIQQHSRIDGLEHLQAALAQGRGVLLLSGHFMTLELAGRLLTRHVPVSGMYRPHDSPALEWAVQRGRAGYAEYMFSHDALRPALRHLRAGGVLWYAPDQDYRRGDSVYVPFFGVPAATITATHQMARISGALVVPFFHRRNANGGLDLRIEAALPDFPGTDPVADTARVNGLIERMVREAPDEYLWAHKRFKNRPAGAPDPYR